MNIKTVWLSGKVLGCNALGLGFDSPNGQCLFFLFKINKRFLNGTFINKHSLVVPVFKHSLVGHLLTLHNGTCIKTFLKGTYFNTP